MKQKRPKNYLHWWWRYYKGLENLLLTFLRKFRIKFIGSKSISTKAWSFQTKTIFTHKSGWLNVFLWSKIRSSTKNFTLVRLMSEISFCHMNLSLQKPKAKISVNHMICFIISGRVSWKVLSQCIKRINYIINLQYKMIPIPMRTLNKFLKMNSSQISHLMNLKR